MILGLFNKKIVKPELIFYNNSTLLEGPVWNDNSSMLYFVSITGNKIFAINIYNNDLKVYNTYGNVGCALITKEGDLYVAEKEGIFILEPITNNYKFISQIEPDSDMRFNDGIIDAKGRFIVGTKGYLSEYSGKGKVYSFDGKIAKTIISNTTISNGLGFSNSGEYLYFIDTPTKKVGKYKYDIENGEVSFEKFVIEIEGDGFPDGLCVDENDNIWVAEWGGSKVCLWNPQNGTKIRELYLPCTNVTSCCIGGLNNQFLFVTTAKNEKKIEPLAGGLFKFKL
jgi:sugar lactone lactonase YvrE